ncbi:MAG: DUF2948 family protein [Geminicoccaceae bacterium]|nr:DUF2948 family protein [Geminicoccaceae bacterium]
MSDKLKLKAADPEDLAVIAACLQDARIPLREMAFLPGERRFAAAFTRYRRERQPDPTRCEGLTECLSALTIEDVSEVKYRGLDANDLDRELVLLTIATEPGKRHLIHIDLVFEGDVWIQLRTDSIRCRLEDFGEPVLCTKTPCDHFAQLTYVDMATDAR